ncbi:NAD-dependent epimerase/dehydratase family protein [Solibacillus daqui]|uniref:NAD-dependent epimerase/dehydratase family protein n=1 Tax=Solibacillus daqui TaxID=2912187 RepID=UPI002366AC76|nr:NAD(P)-dependent oxidoreductase [Solibacillus daqui]
MKILIIGNTSIVGKKLINQLESKKEIEIFTTGRSKNPDILLDFDNHFLPGNIEKYRFDLIIHCVANFEETSVEGSFNNIKVNTLGAVKVVDIAIKTQCKRIISLSSISTISHPRNEYYNSYGISKKAASEIFQLLSKEYGIEYLELSPSQIYDDTGEEKKHQSLLYFIIDKASRGQSITFFGERDVERNYIFLSDLVNIIEKAAFSKITGVYYCCHPKNYKISEIAKIAFKTFENPIQYNFDYNQKNLKTVFIPNNNELYELINYTPKVDLKEGMKLIKQKLY